MKVLDLACAHDHRFEGWFASEDDFVDQCGRGLVNCPVCADASITKRLSAPRLNLGAALPQEAPTQAVALGGEQLQMQAEIQQKVGEIIKKYADQLK